MRRLAVLFACVTAVACFAAVLLGCGGDNVAASELVKSDAPRAAANTEMGSRTSDALEIFSTDLYAVLARNDGNFVFSPYSAAVALAMTRAGAAGETLTQMTDVLHADLAGDLDAGLNTIDQALATRSGEYQGGGNKKVKLQLGTANQLWGQSNYPFRSAFLDRLAAHYGAGMRLVDYIKAPEDARKTINAWVSDQTKGRIQQLIPEGILNSDTRLVLTNAIYLTAPWLYPFERQATAEAPFARLDGSSVQAEMMRLNRELRYVEASGYKAVELPYVDGSLAMLVIVPDKGSFAQFQSALDPETLADIVGGLDNAQVRLGLPKFEFRTQAGLKAPLIELGMPVAFDGDAADFSGMSPDGKNLYIQDVLHEAFIAVDEDGTEAAAATAVVVGRVSAPERQVELTVDRSFLFLIRDTETGAVLFMGRVVDPTR